MRWYPDTCDGFAQGKGCIIDVTSWGVDGATPTGAVVQYCARHSALLDAHADNITTSMVKNLVDNMESLNARKVTSPDGRVYLPDGEIKITYTGNGTVSVEIPNASALDKTNLALESNAKLSGKVKVL